MQVLQPSRTAEYCERSSKVLPFHVDRHSDVIGRNKNFETPLYLSINRPTHSQLRAGTDMASLKRARKA